MRVEKKNLSLRITVCHHSASLVMTNGDPLDGFLYPNRTPMIYSYIIASFIDITLYVSIFFKPNEQSVYTISHFTTIMNIILCKCNMRRMEVDLII